ncbi:MAG: uracil-DNA glycosylase [Coriobacteriia bacterium]|nr:uracil-DNA glycosylase [Coriobacteriia bacterium]
MDHPRVQACETLEELRSYIGDCQRCPLARTRTNLVFGVGSPRARLMFIGEAPGRNEDLQGEPFVGAAGKLLDELLASIGLDRSEVYIANVLKCRPPGNRDPLPEEMEQCTPFLEQQVRLVDPEVIATLGNFATRHVLKTQAGITRLRGRLFRSAGRKVVPIYHPAAALYDRTKQDVLFEDFQRLKAVLEMPAESGDVSGAQRTEARTRRSESAQPGPEQPTLF